MILWIILFVLLAATLLGNILGKLQPWSWGLVTLVMLAILVFGNTAIR